MGGSGPGGASAGLRGERATEACDLARWWEGAAGGASCSALRRKKGTAEGIGQSLTADSRTLAASIAQRLAEPLSNRAFVPTINGSRHGRRIRQ